MADGVEVNLTGLESVLGKMDAVSQVTRNKTGRAALRKAANVIRDRARNNAARVDVRKGRAGKSYNTAGDKGNPGGDTWYWRFLEFGTEHMAARPILRPAMNGVDTDVINIFAVELEKAIDRAVRSAAKKGTSV